jgi:hypothetical protein
MCSIDVQKTSLRNCFSVAPLRPQPCITLARFARSASADFPVFSGLDAPHAWFWLPSHSHLWCSFQRSGVALPSGVRPRLASQATATRFAGCFAHLVRNFVAWTRSKQVARRLS